MLIYELARATELVGCVHSKTSILNIKEEIDERTSI
jgi:hypothetical protein